MPSETRALSADTRAMMLYETQKKSMALSYVLWVFLGGLGVHRFYNGRVGSGVAILLLNVIGALTVFITVGIPLIFAAWIWILVDAFLIPSWVRIHNLKLIGALEGNGATPLIGGAART